MRNNHDWAGEFMTMAHQMDSCKSEELMFMALRKFKDDFNTEYGKLSRAKRLNVGFRSEGGEVNEHVD